MKNKKMQDNNRKQGKGKRKNVILADPRNCLKTALASDGGYQVHHQWHWGGNATWRRSQGDLTLFCDAYWKAHEFKDDDGQTQTSVSWA